MEPRPTGVQTAPWHTPPPRQAALVAAVVARSARSYRRLELIVWAACLFIVGLVAATSGSGALSAFTEGLALVTVMFGAPVSVFSALNRSRIRQLATDGVLAPATVTASRLVGAPGTAIAEVTVTFVRGDGRAVAARASGVPAGLQVGAAARVLVVEATPPRVGLVLPDDALIVARVE
ncbi:MAG: hypothetical protein JNJ54_01535 [Myxococcaceae bacterium]|nr:hypothetical protein [Myxococcaceae bacterium]